MYSGTCLQQCASNEYLDSGVCKSCPSRCARCANSTHCTVCDTYYRWGLVCEYDCTACYSNCNKDDGCSSGCESMYFQFYNIGKASYECARCPDRCSSCGSLNTCTSCENGNWGTICQYSCDSCTKDCDFITGCGENGLLGHYPFQIDTASSASRAHLDVKKCVVSLICDVCEEGYYVDITNYLQNAPLHANETYVTELTEHV